MIFPIGSTLCKIPEQPTLQGIYMIAEPQNSRGHEVLFWKTTPGSRSADSVVLPKQHPETRGSVEPASPNHGLGCAGVEEYI